MKKVAIIGMGVVGSGMKRLFEDKFDVIQYDPKYHAVKEEVNASDLTVVCVPTNMREDGSCDTSIVEEVISWVETPLILIKSTIPPGTVDALSQKYNKKICFSPEYMGESSYFTPPWKYPDPTDAQSHTFVIIGGPEREASGIMNYFMKVMSVDTHYCLCTAREAEIAKYMENAFFATKVTFCNEFYEICEAFDVDYKKVRELWLHDPRINRMHTVVFPDKRGFGGKCLPKDVNAIIKAAESVGYEPTLLKEVLKTNEKIKHSSGDSIPR